MKINVFFGVDLIKLKIELFKELLINIENEVEVNFEKLECKKLYTNNY